MAVVSGRKTIFIYYMAASQVAISQVAAKKLFLVTVWPQVRWPQVKWPQEVAAKIFFFIVWPQKHFYLLYYLRRISMKPHLEPILTGKQTLF